MLFNSYAFILVYLPIVLAGTFLLARYVGADAAQLWLIGASIWFYAAWNIAYLPLLLGSILFNYLIALLMTKRESPVQRRLLLLLAVVVDLSLLGYYKYSNFFLDAVNNVSGTHFRVEEFLLPLGISFYTFQQLTLLVDFSAVTIKEIRLRDFFLFITFFPHLIAGPIVHHREMMPQFGRASYQFDWSNMTVGISLFVAGLFKKAVLADGIATYVSPIYTDAAVGHPISFFYAWAAGIGFVLQVYFDFSGYCEMALGLARMVGIKLPMNFNSPLKAVSIVDFWSRWHITLTRFLTAYLYTPVVVAMTRRRMARGKKVLAGSRTTPGAFGSLVALPIMITMFCSGLWHGAGFQFILYGLLHGAYLIVNQGWRTARTIFWPDKASYQRVMTPVGFVLTFLAVVVAIPLFRASSVHSALNVMSGMLGLHGVALPDAIAHRQAGLGNALAALGVTFAPQSMTTFLKTAAWTSLLLLIAWAPPNVLEVMRYYEPAVTMPGNTMQGRIILFPRAEMTLAWRPTLVWAAVIAVLTVADLLALNRVSEFLYWKF